MCNRARNLVLIGARPALADAWYDPANLNKQLVALAQDERVIGVAACGADFSTRSITPGFPQEFSCLAVGPRIRKAALIRSPGESKDCGSGAPRQRCPRAAFW